MKRVVGLVFGLMLIVTILAACGGNVQNGSQGSNSAPKYSDTGKPADKAEPVTITFMHFKSDVTDAVAKIVDQFQKENPNIKVDVQPVKYDDYYTLLKTKLAGGDVIDVFTLNSGSNTKAFVDGGYVMDLTDQPFVKNFDASVLKEQATDGKNYIMPLNGGPIAVFYNKKIFKDLGIEVPKTWDALMAAAQKIKDAGKTPFALGWKDGWPLAMWATRDLPSNTALIANQPDFFDKLEKGQSKFADNPATKTTLEHAKKYFEYGNQDQFGVDYNGAIDLFASGQAAMCYMGTWALTEIEKRNPDLFKNDLGYFPYPFSNDPSKNKLEFNPDASLAVSSKTEHKDAALKFMAFMASKEAGDLWVNNVKSLSYVKGSSTNIAPAIDDLKPFIDAGNVYNSQLYIANTTIDWAGQFDKELQNYLFNKMTPDQLIKNMDDWVQKNHK
jgi:raffinose/stachyose/melibiose transport system substrate-binding protein